MSDKLVDVMVKPLAMIDALIAGNPSGEQLNASEFTMAVCDRLLSTHSESGWRIMDPIRARKAELMNAALVENLEHELLEMPTSKICPSEITSGMFVSNHGYIGEVVSVDRYENKEDKEEPYTYVVNMTYVCGDLGRHKYFTGRINRGTAAGYLSQQQGNRRAGFYVVNTGK